MNPSSRIDKKGRITLPLEIRRRLGLASGERVEFSEKEGQTIIHRASGSENPFEKYRGILPAFSSKNEIKAWTRFLRDED
jgi:AbrB family looped-hinge helix DNA binding protein